MKICPQCRTTYADDTLQFCLQDGENLIPAQDANTETPTVVLPNKERYTTNKNLDKMRIDIQNSQADDWQNAPDKTEPVAESVAEPKNSKTLVAILATALAMLLLFAAGIGAWFYLGENDAEIVQNTNNNKFNVKTGAENDNEKITPSPTAAKKATPKTTPTAEPTQTPAPDFDSEKVKKDVSARVISWKSAAESLNLDSYMNNYASKIDFYNKKNASLDFVRRDKQRAFSVYDSIKMNFGNIRVIPDETGEKATAVFDKQWNFSGEEKSSEGKVQTELKLTKIGGEWKITGERDLKVYYVK